MNNKGIAFGDLFKIISEGNTAIINYPLSIIHLRDSATNGSSNIPPRERIGRSKMRNEYHQTISPEIVSGHCPPNRAK